MIASILFCFTRDTVKCCKGENIQYKIYFNLNVNTDVNVNKAVF